MKMDVFKMLLGISLPTDHLPTTATLFIATSIYLPTLIHSPTVKYRERRSLTKTVYQSLIVLLGHEYLYYDSEQ